MNFVVNGFLALVQFVLRILKKALCCLRRRRRLSCEPVALTNIGVVPNTEKSEDIQSWVSWEDSTDKIPTMITTTKPVDPIQQQIDMYRQQRMALAQKDDKEEPKIDYFQDMVPKIVRQEKKVLEPKEEEQYGRKNNFSFAPDPAFGTNELGVWDDSQSWENQAEQSWDANDLIREKKKLDREERLAKQQKKKLERKNFKFQSNGTGWTPGYSTY